MNIKVRKSVINAVFAAYIGLFIVIMLLGEAYSELASLLMKAWFAVFILLVVPFYLYLLVTWRIGGED
jgi:hypothetical protein